MRKTAWCAWLAVALAAGAALAAPTVALAQRTTDVTPEEIDGQINGKKARFLARGEDVLVTTAEAERLGLPYRDGKSISIGGTPLWLVTLDSVTVSGATRLNAPAGVVPSIPGYFAALRAHPAEAFARSRETTAEINGVAVKAYDLGISGLLVAPAEADRAGLKYREGKQQNVGQASAWVIETTVKIGGAPPATAIVTVSQPEAFFEAALAGASKPR